MIIYIYPPVAFALMASAVTVFLLYIQHSEVLVVLMLSLFTATTAPSWHDSSLLIVELYPTRLRLSDELSRGDFTNTVYAWCSTVARPS